MDCQKQQEIQKQLSPNWSSSQLKYHLASMWSSCCRVPVWVAVPFDPWGLWLGGSVRIRVKLAGGTAGTWSDAAPCSGSSQVQGQRGMLPVIKPGSFAHHIYIYIYKSHLETHYRQESWATNLLQVTYLMHLNLFFSWLTDYIFVLLLGSSWQISLAAFSPHTQGPGIAFWVWRQTLQCMASGQAEHMGCAHIGEAEVTLSCCCAFPLKRASHWYWCLKK